MASCGICPGTNWREQMSGSVSAARAGERAAGRRTSTLTRDPNWAALVSMKSRTSGKPPSFQLHTCSLADAKSGPVSSSRQQERHSSTGSARPGFHQRRASRTARPPPRHRAQRVSNQTYLDRRQCGRPGYRTLRSRGRRRIRGSDTAWPPPQPTHPRPRPLRAAHRARIACTPRCTPPQAPSSRKQCSGIWLLFAGLAYALLLSGGTSSLP